MSSTLSSPGGGGAGSRSSKSRTASTSSSGFNSLPAMTHTLLMLVPIGLLQVLLVLPLSAAVIAEHHADSGETRMLTTECEVYNATSCLANGSDCSGTMQCMSEYPERNRCFALWLNSSEGKVELTTKGCIVGDHSCHNQTKCVSKYEHHRTKSMNPHDYCCCVSNNCNKEYSRQPVPLQVHKPASDNTSSGVAVMVLLTLGSLCILVVIIAVVFYCYRKSNMPPYFHPLPGGTGCGTSDGTSATNGSLPHCRNSVTTALPESVSQHTAVSTLCPPVHRPVQLLEVKAKGRFGALWMATCTGEHVAVKIFPASDRDSWHVEKEVYGLPQFRHSNILKFIGVEKHGENLQAEYWLISAYHYRGSLSDYLKANLVSWSDVRRIAESMAQGLCFLHEEQQASQTEAAKPVIAHRDFKSKNVLLKADLTACIADFGLAIVFYQGQSPGDTHGQVGTRRYMAPEVLEGAISFQADAFLRIDMYACGLVLWELVTRCSGQEGPVGDYKLPFEEEVGYHPTLDDMQECVVVQKCRPAIKKHWLKHPGLEVVVSTMEECWDHDSEARLTAACVVERLSSHALMQISESPQSTVNATHNAANIALTAATSPGSAQPEVLRNTDNHLYQRQPPPAAGGVGAHPTAVLNNRKSIGTTALPAQQNTPGSNAASTMNGIIPNVGHVNINQVPMHMNNNINAATNMANLMQKSNSNVHSLNLNNPPMRYPNGTIVNHHLPLGIRPLEKYNSASSSNSSSNSCSSNSTGSSSRGSSSGSNGGFISHHTALSNQIPRHVAGMKHFMPPTVNVPLPQSSSAASIARPQATVSGPSQQPGAAHSLSQIPQVTMQPPSVLSPVKQPNQASV